jgi:hypothetical protein
MSALGTDHQNLLRRFLPNEHGNVLSLKQNSPATHAEVEWVCTDLPPDLAV